MSRRATGEGSIKKAPDGSWRGAIRLGTDQLGKPIRRYVRGRTQTEVRAKLDALRTDNKARVDMAAGAKPTVASWLKTMDGAGREDLQAFDGQTYRTYVRYATEALALPARGTRTASRSCSPGGCSALSIPPRAGDAERGAPVPAPSRDGRRRYPLTRGQRPISAARVSVDLLAARERARAVSAGSRRRGRLAGRFGPWDHL